LDYTKDLTIMNIPKEILDISRELKTQDNRITVFPVFMVQQLERTCWSASGDEGETIYLDYDGNECDPDEEGAAECGYQDKWVNVQPFFTEKSAMEYIKANSHRLIGPDNTPARIYAESAYRNYEWQNVVNFLKSLTDGGS
jgi:hypothetical protein